MICGYLLKQNWECSIGCDSFHDRPAVDMGDTCPYDEMEECPCFFGGGDLIGVV